VELAPPAVVTGLAVVAVLPDVVAAPASVVAAAPVVVAAAVVSAPAAVVLEPLSSLPHAATTTEAVRPSASAVAHRLLLMFSSWGYFPAFTMPRSLL
jgi:hypothetical protein